MKKDTENLNIVLEKEKENIKVKSTFFWDLLVLLWSLFIFLYFFSNGTKIVVFPEEAELDARVKSRFF